MGGGVGISEPAEVRIATERTTYAMPETGIGLFPDVGGGWFLPRLPGQTGVWLALTGARLKAADTVALGIHTHFVPSDASGRLEGRPDRASRRDPVAGGATARRPMPARRRSPRTARPSTGCSPSTRSRTIFAALEADGSDWALAQLATLKTKSPQSLKVTLRQLRTGAGAEDLRRRHGDGIPAGRPGRADPRLPGRRPRRHRRQGQYAELVAGRRWTAVTDADLDALFAPLPADQEWTPCRPRPSPRGSSARQAPDPAGFACIL